MSCSGAGCGSAGPLGVVGQNDSELGADDTGFWRLRSPHVADFNSFKMLGDALD